MEVDVENSCLECDSNAMILPAKKSNKRKGMHLKHEGAKKNINPKLSKSQKCKLKKLEEEEERKILLSKSIETLEKYKIPEDTFSLLRSSKNLSRVETIREKGRMAVQFSKAGLEVPLSGQPFKRCGGSASFETETESRRIRSRLDINKNDHLQPMVVEKKVPSNASVSLAPYQEPVSGNEVCLNGGSIFAFSAEEVSTKDNCTTMQEDIQSSSVTLCRHDARKQSKIMSKLDKSSSVNLDKQSNLSDYPLQNPPITPIVVHVSRPNDVEEKRKDLPIVMMEQEIMETINERSFVIICGKTGCGKTTQVPQFLYEAGFGSKRSVIRSGVIGVTQPRRVAVLATARRVAFELGLRLGKEVGFQVRHDKRIGESCSIKFMTDGILLREAQSDVLLRRYSVIILDEAHERSVNTDILIGMLSRMIGERQKLFEEQQQLVLSGQRISSENMIFPLKLVVMSATLRKEDFDSESLFPDARTIDVPHSLFPVPRIFSKRTEIVDYIGQAYKSVLMIHRRLPQGGILVFVTGQSEVEYLCQKLHKASRELVANTAIGNTVNEVTAMSEMNSIEGIDMEQINEAFEIQGDSSEQQTDRFWLRGKDMSEFCEDELDVSYDSETDSEIEIVDDDDDDDDGFSWDQKTPENESNLLGFLGEERSLTSLKAAFEAFAGKIASKSNSECKQIPFTPKGCPEQSKHHKRKERRRDNGLSAGPLHVLPLYAMLPAAAQLRVFEKVKEGERLVVIATNVAEASLTIPGIKYVVDTGREKVKNYNPSNGMETYEIQWISKASAAQRAGRAGRTGPGLCYRLYSTAVFNNIFPRHPCPEISKVPLHPVVLLLKSLYFDKVKNFPFPTPPEATALEEAECCLKTLEALDSIGRLTSLGKAMACYPLSPRHSRMLLTLIQIMRKVKNYGRANLVLGYAVAAAAALSLSSPFLMHFEGSHSDSKGLLEQDRRSGNPDNEKILDKQENLRKKKLKEMAKVSRARFSNPCSDSLTVAYALQCFEVSESPVEFCQENALHLKTMDEMSKLRKQLLQLVFNQNVNHGGKQDFSWTHGTMEEVEKAWRISSQKSSLSLNEEELLGQAICAGWVDRVAKRMRGNSGSSSGDRKANAVWYQACAVKEDAVFLHRWSSLSNSAPEFLVFSELLRTKRPYMHGATRVKPEWLVKYAGSLCSFSTVEDPKPYYEPRSDQVFSWVIPTFGPHRWQLPLHSVPMSSGVDRVKVFACALLEGHVLPCLGSVRKFMAARPSSLLNREAAGERRVGNLLFKFETRLIDSCAVLREVWEENPRELYSEILDWFEKNFHNRFGALWLQMHSEIQLEPNKCKSVKRDERKKQICL